MASRGVRREVGSGERCEPPRGSRGPWRFWNERFSDPKNTYFLEFLIPPGYKNFMLFSSYIVIRTTSSWMRSCPITRFDTKKCQCQWIAQFWVLFFTWTKRPVGVLNFGHSFSLWSKAKRSCSQSYPHALFASPTVGSIACTCVLDSLYSPWDGTLPHWCCPSLRQVDYERSAASTIFSQRLMLNV